MRHGVRLGIDVGKARIGVARCDPHGLLATPLETVPRARGTDRGDLRRILELVGEHAAFEAVVGLPFGLSGHRTPSTEDAELFAQRLLTAARAEAGSGRAALEVRLVDERLSTVSAQQGLRDAGRSTKKSRNVIDQAAAVVILQHALDLERGRGVPPGTVIGADEAEDRRRGTA
ncbi:Holliday junction resolvase RuvX [Leucobacter weissii]|uniref:Putative pre-16S rRNA nuclease n=1 Tax=Leucobacter weissii TaxID=1983706 RepID=A0A939MMB0_9MICO|nr:Holliday junction resolvase RuvX [Leucobacter weissii]MBO1902870.1 Holliday junction resolvase RuvX [Leucobacter weissii]